MHIATIKMHGIPWYSYRLEVYKNDIKGKVISIIYYLEYKRSYIRYRAVAQTIILAARKKFMARRNSRKKIFQCYVVQGVGMLNFIGNL